MVAHGCHGEPRPVGHAVDVPFRYAHGGSQVAHVGGVLGGGVAGEIDAFLDEPVAARSHGLEVEGVLFVFGKVLVESVEYDLGIFGAVEGGLRRSDAALIEDDHVALFEEALEDGQLVQGGLDDAGARPSREVQDGIGFEAVRR